MTVLPRLVATLTAPSRPGYDRPEDDEQVPAEQLPSRPRTAARPSHEETTPIASRRGRATADTEQTDLAPPTLRLVAGTSVDGRDATSTGHDDLDDLDDEDADQALSTASAGRPTSAPDAESEFSELFRAMHTEVRTFAVRRTELELVDDVVGDTFLAVWHGWDKVPTDPSGRRAWVYGILRNKVMQATQNAGRRARLRAKVSSLRPTGQGAVDEAIESLRAARDLLDLLPPGERDAVALTVLGGLTCAETAEVLECSLSSVTTRVSRARTRLRTLLAERATTQHDGGERR